MAKKNGADEGFFLIFCALIGLVGLPLFINTYLVRKHYAEKFQLGSGEMRVTEETGNMVKNFALGAVQVGALLILGLFLILLGCSLIYQHEQPIHIFFGIISIILGLISLISCFGKSAFLGASQIGMLVFPDK